jgi:hypothetical protein
VSRQSEHRYKGTHVGREKIGEDFKDKAERPSKGRHTKRGGREETDTTGMLMRHNEEGVTGQSDDWGSNPDGGWKFISTPRPD